MGLQGDGVTQQPCQINFGQCSPVHATLAAVLAQRPASQLCDGLELAAKPGRSSSGPAPGGAGWDLDHVLGLQCRDHTMELCSR